MSTVQRSARESRVLPTNPVPLDKEQDILREVLAQMRARLPKDWDLSLERDTPLFGPDAIVSLRPPQGKGAIFLIEAKRTLVTRDLGPIVEQLNAYASAPFIPRGSQWRSPAIPMVIARYLSPPLQKWMTEQDVPYADATGNIRISLDAPALFLRDVGSTKDPWRGPGRPKGSLKGEPPARVVRALVDFTPPYSIPAIIERSGASSGATYRVIEFLQEQMLVDRAPRGPIEGVTWRALLDRWASDYGFMRTNTVSRYLAPRGLPELMTRLADVSSQGALQYAVTGSLAAQKWAPYAPARNAMIYTEDPVEFAGRLGLRQVETGANVILARSAYDVVYDRCEEYEGSTIVSPSQAAVDLLTGPGRNPAEAEALLDWMEAHESRWRR